MIWLAGGAAQAQGSPDLMKTPECLAARTVLEQALAAGGPRDRLTAAREQAGLQCLGQRPPPLPDARLVPPATAIGEPIRLRPATALSVPLGPKGVCTLPGGVLNCP